MGMPLSHKRGENSYPPDTDKESIILMIIMIPGHVWSMLDCIDLICLLYKSIVFCKFWRLLYIFFLLIHGN